MHVNEIRFITPGSKEGSGEEFNEAEAIKAALTIIAEQIGGKVVDGKIISNMSLTNTTFDLFDDINCRVTF